MDLVRKLQNRVVHLYSSGSPLRYTRKLYLTGKNISSLSKRYKLAKDFRVDKGIAETARILDENGYCDVTHDLDKDLYPTLVRDAEERLNSEESHHSVVARKYFGELLSEADRDTKSIFVRFALQENILKKVSAHFGQVPHLFGVSLLLSKPTADGQWLESQLWHRDYDDSKILKLFVYLTDVNTKNDGPFTYIPPKTSKKVGRSFIPKRITDQEMTERGGIKDTQEIFGKKGTGFLIDTARCYHMGSRCITSSRLAYVATYTTNAPLDHEMKFAEASGLDEFQRLVLGRC